MMTTESRVYTTCDTPFGTAVIAGKCGKISHVRVMTSDGRFGPDPSWRRVDGEFVEARAQLAAYFAGTLKDFSLPLELFGTPFQQHAWRLLRAVGYGTTTTYGAIARAMGRPEASRAVGRAMNQNPISIIVPCHRVLAKDGALTGYLNGLEMKRRLLAMESASQAPARARAG